MRIEVAGHGFDQHILLDADGIGGVVFCSYGTPIIQVDQIDVCLFSIMARFTPTGSGIPWMLTMVYGPHDEARNTSFLNELMDLHNYIVGPWVVIRDFNLIMDNQDKNNNNLCRCWVARLHHALNSLAMHVIPLNGHRFRWSNERSPNSCQHGSAFL